MNSSLQDWMLKLDGMLGTMKEEILSGTIKSTVVEETSALAARLERVEEKIDQVLAELRSARRP